MVHKACFLSISADSWHLFLLPPPSLVGANVAAVACNSLTNAAEDGVRGRCWHPWTRGSTVILPSLWPSLRWGWENCMREPFLNCKKTRTSAGSSSSSDLTELHSRRVKKAEFFSNKKKSIGKQGLCLIDQTTTDAFMVPLIVKAVL